jgi:hypothetical protein
MCLEWVDPIPKPIADDPPALPILDLDPLECPKLMLGQPSPPTISSDSDAANGWTQHSSPQVSVDDHALSAYFTLSNAPKPSHMTHEELTESHFPLEILEHRLQYMSGAPQFSERYLIECADLNPELRPTAPEQKRLGQYRVQNERQPIPSFWPPRCYDCEPFADPIADDFVPAPKGDFVVRLPSRRARYPRPTVRVPAGDSELELETDYSDF